MPKARAGEYFIDNAPVILAGFLSLVIVDILQLLIPRIVKRAVDDLSLMSIEPYGLLRYVFLLLVMGTAIAAFRYIWRRCLIGASRNIEKELRTRLVSHIHRLDTACFDSTSTGDLMARATNDINNIRMATGLGLVALTDAIFLGTAAIGFMAYINVRLTLYSLLPMPLIVVFTKIFSRRMHRTYLSVQAAFSDMTETTREKFAGIRVIKAFGREEEETRQFEVISKNYIRKNLQLTRVTGTFFPMMLFFTNVSIAITLLWGGKQTITTVITPGDFVAFISYLGLLTWPMMAMGWVTNLVQRGKASFDRINQILEAEPVIKEAPDARPLSNPRGRITFREVVFSYPGSNGPVLRGIDLELPAGKTTCIVGPPGSGKSTLVNLMARLYDPDRGVVRIDGFDIRSLKIKDLRSAISLMPQEPFLFSGTIRENITFDRTTPDTDERLVKACRNAALCDTIQRFPKGFDTVVGEKGIVLSGGQKQRVALARALYHDSPVLVLDDPVSQVDSGTAARILKGLRSCAGQKTVVMVSHRLSAARLSDLVVVMENGCVTETGTHEQLASGNGYYSRAWELQKLDEVEP
ncbi:MAG: multidrug ABC transporter permease [Desulfococcus sp. 4484_241]|nr:MAG: multidrug ABC transporter permease [Desulfococcus sp. 4484_241]